MTKTGWIIAIAALAAVTFAAATGCRSGWDVGFCADGRATIAPFIGGSGEFMLTEVMSLVACLLGLLVAYNGYINGDDRGVRLSALFIIFFVIALIGENNLMRDDIRPQFLLILLLWISVELAIARAPFAIVLIVLGMVVPALGQLGDHTTLIEFENLFGEQVSDTALAPWARTFGGLEEPLELTGWLLFVMSAIAGLDLRPINYRRARLMLCAALFVSAIAVGNSLLHLGDNDTFEGFRKLGLFCSVAGVAFFGTALLWCHGDGGMLPRVYCALAIVIAYWIGVYAPAVYTHEHSKTISSWWLWIFPVFSAYYVLVSFRRAALTDPSSNAAVDQRPT